MTNIDKSAQTEPPNGGKDEGPAIAKGAAPNASSSPTSDGSLRHAYEESTDPLDVIAAHHGLSRQKLVAMAQREGWAARTKRQTGSRATSRSTPRRSRPVTKRRRGRAERASAQGLKAVAARLALLLEAELGDVEARLATERSSKEREREARRLASLVRAVDRLLALENQTGKASGRTASSSVKPSASGESHEKDTLAELERRLARLAAEGDG